MNPLCPKTNEFCFVCTEPCPKPELPSFESVCASKTELEEITTLLGELTDAVSIETDFESEASIHVSFKL